MITHIHTHTYIHTYTNTYVYTHIHTYTVTYIHTQIYAYIHTYIHSVNPNLVKMSIVYGIYHKIQNTKYTREKYYVSTSRTIL